MDMDLADVGLYSIYSEATQRMLGVVIRETKAAGLFINVAKTKYFVHGELAATLRWMVFQSTPWRIYGLLCRVGEPTRSLSVARLLLGVMAVLCLCGVPLL
jgi:hypothetical protein